ncbi:MAG: CHAT domain-containing protein [Lewinellaceae bacterium]|nr:CHAT domain-containing protein [Phaeodactylibacter sp.]MCB0611769.1 CHAT domain-containing protein [Phaeodactylibacter sp.]MCB9346813.1 CHAT domain-containing protein [Lewinellaceae bacterium]
MSKTLLFSALLLISFSACKQEPAPPPCPTSLETGLSVLLAGLAEGAIRPDSAILLLSLARPELETCKGFKKDSLLASLLDELGKKLLHGKPVDSELYSRQALMIRKQLFGDSLHKDVLRMYYNIGSAHLLRKNYHQAISYFDSASVRPIAELPQLFVYGKLKIGQAYLEIGELNNALFYFQLASDSMKAYPRSEGKRLELITAFASCYRLLREYDKGVKKASEELSPEVLLAKGDALADLCLVLGNIWQDSLLDSNQEQARQQAVFYTQQALSFYQERPEGPDMEERVSIAGGNLGELYRRVGHFQAAVDVLTSGLNFLKGRDAQSGLFAQLYTNRGEAYADLKRYEAALVDYDSALARLIPAIRNKEQGALPSIQAYSGNRKDLMALLADIALTNLALFEEKEEDTALLKKAVAAYDTLYQLINLVRGDFISDDAKLELAAGSREILGKAFQGCLKLYQKTNDPRYKEQAFRISEQSKAFVLLEAARLKNVSSMLPESDRQREEELLLARAEIEGQLLQAWKDPAEKKRLEKSLARNFEQIRLYQQQLKEAHPRYHALKYQGAGLSSVAIREGLLDKGQSLIEYFYQDSFLYIFLLSRESIELQTVAIPPQQMARQINRFREILERGRPGEVEQEAEFCQLAYSLYQYLLAPVENRLSERLIIIPAGPLNNLPFEALLKKIDSGGIPQQIAKNNFVLFNHAISYCFSANLLSLMQSGPKRPSRRKGVAIFASAFSHGLSQGADRSELPPALLRALPFLTPLGINQNEEVNQIRQNIRKVTLYENEAASKKAFLKACQEFSIIHIPTHGILNEQDPGYSFISFSQLGEEIDLSELLFVKDLYAQHWEGLDLIFLSACQTASGRFMEGEGNISLARGMAYTGVNSLATTLWNVPTAAKSKIAPAFYLHFLQEGQPKDVALAEAKRSVARQYHPKDWAGLILIGSSK